jgi:hypothetical protein
MGQDSRGSLHETGYPKMEALDKVLHFAGKLEAIGAMIGDVFWYGDDNLVMAINGEEAADIIIDDAQAIEEAINEGFSKAYLTEDATEAIVKVFHLTGKLKVIGLIIQDISFHKDNNQVLEYYGNTAVDIIIDDAKEIDKIITENYKLLKNSDDKKINHHR